MHPETRRCSVLVVGSRLPSAERLERIVERLGDSAEVVLAYGARMPRQLAVAGISRSHAIGADVVGQGPAFRRALRRATGEQRFAVHATHDGWLRTELAGADVVLTLDPRAKGAIERLTEFHSGVAVVESAAGAKRALRQRTASPPGSSPALCESGVGRWRSPSQEVRRLLDEGHLSQAAALALRTTRQGAVDLRAGADLLGDVVHSSLERGEHPECLVEAVTAELAVADAEAGRGNFMEAAESD